MIWSRLIQKALLLLAISIGIFPSACAQAQNSTLQPPAKKAGKATPAEQIFPGSVFSFRSVPTAALVYPSDGVTIMVTSSNGKEFSGIGKWNDAPRDNPRLPLRVRGTIEADRVTFTVEQFMRSENAYRNMRRITNKNSATPELFEVFNSTTADPPGGTLWTHWHIAPATTIVELPIAKNGYDLARAIATAEQRSKSLNLDFEVAKKNGLVCDDDRSGDFLQNGELCWKWTPTRSVDDQFYKELIRLENIHTIYLGSEAPRGILRELKGLRRIEYLQIAKGHTSELHALRGGPEIGQFRVGSSAPSTLEEIARLDTIESLVIDSVEDNTASLAALATLPKLTSLTIGLRPRKDDIGLLGSLASLRSLKSLWIKQYSSPLMFGGPPREDYVLSPSAMREILRACPQLTHLSIDQLDPKALAAIRSDQLRSLIVESSTPRVTLEDLAVWHIPASLTEVRLPISWSPTLHTLRKLAELTPEDRRSLSDVSGLSSGIFKYQELDFKLSTSDISGVSPEPIIRQQRQLANDMHEKSVSAATLAARLHTASMLSTADAVLLQTYLYEYSGFWHPHLKEHLSPYEILQAEAARSRFLNIVQEAQQ